MKKTLLVLTTTTLLSTSAMAAPIDTFYIRGDVGANMFAKETVKTPSSLGSTNASFKGKTSAAIDVGIGYKVTEEFRVELVFGHHISPKMNGSHSSTSQAVRIGAQTNNITAKASAKIETLMLRTYFDIYDFEIGKVFMGFGIGVAQVSEKVTGAQTIALVGRAGSPKNFDLKTKKHNNFAYSVGFGTTFKLSQRADLDLQYNWSDYGHGKNKNDAFVIKHRAHSIKAGVRFAL